MNDEVFNIFAIDINCVVLGFLLTLNCLFNIRFFKLEPKAYLSQYVILLVLVCFIVALIKVFYIKARPMFFKDQLDNYQSFPSGHTAASVFAFCFNLFFVLSTPDDLSDNKNSRNLTGWVLIVQFYIFIIFIPASRLFSKKHFFIDVVFGALIGFLIPYMLGFSKLKLNTCEI